MLTATLLLFSISQLNTKPAPVFADVFVGNNGPYRFLIDTGSQTSLIDPALAATLHLQFEFRVAILTQNSTEVLPALKMRTLRVGRTVLQETEVVVHDMTEARRRDASVVGLLGINALAGLNFAMFPQAGRLDMIGERPDGERVPFYRVEDRIAVKARMGREELTLILDSGATHIVFFRTPEAMTSTPPVAATLGTMEGARSAVPTCWTADMTLTKRLRFGTLPAAIVNRPGTQVDGLLPASLFKAVYVDQGRGEVVLVR